MNPIKTLEQLGAKFSVTGNSVNYDISNIPKTVDKDVVANELFEIQKNKKWAIDYLLNISLPPNVVVIDIETTSKRSDDGEIALIGYADKDKNFATQNIESLRETLKNEKLLKVFHNAVFDVVWLEEKGYIVKNYTDTMVMSQVLNNRIKNENSLAYLALKYLGIHMNKKLQDETNWQNGITKAHIKYCKLDALITYKLYQVLKKKIDDLMLNGVLRREVKALPAVIELNRCGIQFDFKGWVAVLKEYVNERDVVARKIKLLFNTKDLNLNSPIQIKEILHGIGIKVTSTKDEELAKYDQHTVVSLLRRYKKLNRKISAYGSKLKQKVSNDGVLKGNWRLIGANTFRMTCSKPNLQGMPRESKKFFKARNGKMFVIADYSQIELRVLAHLSDDPLMIEAFRKGDDLHIRTATMILGKDASDVTKEERQIAKTANFGLVYGMTAFGLRKRIIAEYAIDISIEEAEKIRNGYFNTYRGVLAFQDRMLRAERIETLGGRRWDVSMGELLRGKISRYNYPVQGSAAEGLKEALALLTDSKKNSWKIVAVVHDEIVMEVPHEEVEEASYLLEKVMKSGMQKLVTKVPIEVELNVSKVWSK